MNQILVTKKLYITPELKRKKKLYKFYFFLSVFLVFTLISFYIYAEVDRSKSEETSQAILDEFNQELDNLTMVVKEENKEKTLENLSKLYEYIPRFAKMLTDNTTYRAVIETKNNLFKAYSKLDSKNWDEISNDLKQAIDTYSNQLINTNKDSDKQYVINKIYIMLNELQNAVNVQDESIFLIKYKNILEEMNNL